jgi:hypothetical protein
VGVDDFGNMAVTAKATPNNSLIGEELIKLTMSTFESCARRTGSPQLLVSIFADHQRATEPAAAMSLKQIRD